MRLSEFAYNWLKAHPEEGIHMCRSAFGMMEECYSDWCKYKGIKHDSSWGRIMLAVSHDKKRWRKLGMVMGCDWKGTNGAEIPLPIYEMISEPYHEQ